MMELIRRQAESKDYPIDDYIDDATLQRLFECSTLDSSKRLLRLSDDRVLILNEQEEAAT